MLKGFHWFVLWRFRFWFNMLSERNSTWYLYLSLYQIYPKIQLSNNKRRTTVVFLTDRTPINLSNSWRPYGLVVVRSHSFTFVENTVFFHGKRHKRSILNSWRADGLAVVHYWFHGILMLKAVFKGQLKRRDKLISITRFWSPENSFEGIFEKFVLVFEIWAVEIFVFTDSEGFR